MKLEGPGRQTASGPACCRCFEGSCSGGTDGSMLGCSRIEFRRPDPKTRLLKFQVPPVVTVAPDCRHCGTSSATRTGSVRGSPWPRRIPAGWRPRRPVSAQLQVERAPLRAGDSERPLRKATLAAWASRIQRRQTGRRAEGGLAHCRVAWRNDAMAEPPTSEGPIFRQEQVRCRSQCG